MDKAALVLAPEQPQTEAPCAAPGTPGTRTSTERARYSHVHVLVQLCCKVTRHLSTAVIVPVVFRQMIHVMEDHAVPGVVLHGLFEAHVKEHRAIERLCASLHGTEKSEMHSDLVM